MKRNVIDQYPRETVDFIPLVDLALNGTVVTDATDVEVAIVGEQIRPLEDTWSTAIDGAGQIGFLLNGPQLGRGVYAIYVRPTSGSIRPVVLVGHIRLT